MANALFSRLVGERSYRCGSLVDCPTALRERLFLAALNGTPAPRLLGDLFDDGFWRGYYREYIEGADAATLLLGLLRRSEIDEAARIAYEVGAALASLHRRAMCLEPLFLVDASHFWGEFRRELATWAGFLSARGWSVEARLLLDVATSSEDDVWDANLLPTHDDSHFGQFIIDRGSVYVVDFRGEPFRRPLWLFLGKPPERDVAVLLRSLDYLMVFAGEDRWGNIYRRLCRSIIEGYESVAMDALDKQLLGFMIAERAGYEVFYEFYAGTGLEWLPLSAIPGIHSGAWDCSQ